MFASALSRFAQTGGPMPPPPAPPAPDLGGSGDRHEKSPATFAVPTGFSPSAMLSAMRPTRDPDGDVVMEVESEPKTPPPTSCAAFKIEGFPIAPTEDVVFRNSDLTVARRVPLHAPPKPAATIAPGYSAGSLLQQRRGARPRLFI